MKKISIKLFSLAVMGLLGMIGQAWAQSNLVILVSQPSEPIYAGTDYFTTNLNNFGVEMFPGQQMTVWTTSSAINVSISNGAPIAAGDYPNAVYPFTDSAPGLAVFGNGRGCDSVCADFQIYEYATDAGGNPTRLWMTFTQYCECGGAPLTGEVRYHSQLAPSSPPPQTRLVPAEYPTIQSAIDAASFYTADTVLVSNGLYYENLDFDGKAITVTSVNGPQWTTVDGGGGQAAVNIDSESTNAIINGFTLANASYGVSAFSTSPTICSNVILNCFFGVYVDSGSPQILDNQISGCQVGADFAGGSPVVAGNLLATNVGSALSMDDGSSPEIIGNIIRGNGGDGITMLNGDDPAIIQNVIVGNGGNGISYDVGGYVGGPFEINNTIVGNGGAGIDADGYDSTAVIIGNIVVGTPALQASVFSGSAPVISNNDFYSTNGVVFAGGIFTNITGMPGNISANPQFAVPPETDFHLQADSPCIDAGDNDAPDLPGTDFDGNPRILAGQFNGVPIVDQGAFEFNPSNPPPTYLAPSILRQPQDTNVSGGQDFVLSILMAGSPPLEYQWSYQGMALAGQNTNTLAIADVQSVNDGFYSVMVFNGAGFTNSRSARVRVLPAKPTIVSNPAPVTAAAASTATFSVAARGSAPMEYQWYRGTNLVAAFAGPILTLANVQAADAGSYSAVVSNADGVATSKGAALTVRAAPPVFDEQPESAEVYFGARLSFYTQVSGSEPIHYQWYFQGRPIAGAAGPYLVITKATKAQAGDYYLVATNLAGKAVSSTVSLAVDVPPQPVRLLTNQVVRAGQVVELAFAANGDAPLTYAWQLNGTPLAWTNPVLVISNIQPAQAGYYQVTAENGFGAYSSSARIAMVAPASRLVAWGDDSTHQTNAPAGLSNIVAAAGGDFHTIAILANGKVVAWGDNTDGQTNVPAGLPAIVAIAAGASHSLAIGLDGSLHAWGNDDSGQCDLWDINVDQPVAVSAGDQDSLALMANGMVAAWGDNTYGQTTLPDALAYNWWGPGLDWMPASAIGAGRIHNMAVLTNGSVVAWGDNSGGECNVPVDLTNATAVVGGYLHSVALRADGTVTAWGDDTYGQTNVPPGLTNVIAISAGDYNTLALLANGTVVGWGDNSYGAISIPASLTNVVAIASGYYHSLALTTGKSKTPAPVSLNRH